MPGYPDRDDFLSSFIGKESEYLDTTGNESIAPARDFARKIVDDNLE